MEVEGRQFGLSRLGETPLEPLIHRKNPNKRGRTICGERTRDTTRKRRDVALEMGERCRRCFPSHGDEEVAADGGEPDGVGVGAPVVQGVGLDDPLAVVNLQGVPFTDRESLEITRGQAVAGVATALVVGGLAGVALS